MPLLAAFFQLQGHCLYNGIGYDRTEAVFSVDEEKTGHSGCGTVV